MDIKIRDHILHNFEGDNKEELKAAIEESIKEQDEITLPGMGVFFEIVWQDANEELKEEILSILENRCKKKEKSE